MAIRDRQAKRSGSTEIGLVDRVAQRDARNRSAVRNQGAIGWPSPESLSRATTIRVLRDSGGGHVSEVILTVHRPAERSLSRIAVLALWLVAVLIVAIAAPSVAASWTETSSTDFSGGTLQNTVVNPEGSVQLASETTWVKHGLVLDLSEPGAADSVWARDPFVLREDDGTYRMWYRGADDFRWRIMLATSHDGISWTKEGIVLDVFGTIGAPFVLREEATYHMWFQGGPGGGGAIYHATSTDGRSWTLDGSALGPGPFGSWDGLSVNTPWVVRGAAGYLLYYLGTDGLTDRIGVAASSGFTGFVRLSAAPVLDIGPPGAWDGSKVRFPSVVPGSPWTMYYAGLDGGVWRLGKASSTDGISWTKSVENPFLGPDPYPSWDYNGLVGAALLDDPSGPRLYYTGWDGFHLRVGLAIGSTSFVASGAYVSRVFDSGRYGTAWRSLASDVVVSGGTSLTLLVRAGNRPMPDGSWTEWNVLGPGGFETQLRLPRFRYVQYRADFTTPDSSVTPVLSEVSVTFTLARGG